MKPTFVNFGFFERRMLTDEQQRQVEAETSEIGKRKLLAEMYEQYKRVTVESQRRIHEKQRGALAL